MRATTVALALVLALGGTPPGVASDRVEGISRPGAADDLATRIRRRFHARRQALLDGAPPPPTRRPTPPPSARPLLAEEGRLRRGRSRADGPTREELLEQVILLADRPLGFWNAEPLALDLAELGDPLLVAHTFWADVTDEERALLRRAGKAGNLAAAVLLAHLHARRSLHQDGPTHTFEAAPELLPHVVPTEAARTWAARAARIARDRLAESPPR